MFATTKIIDKDNDHIYVLWDTNEPTKYIITALIDGTDDYYYDTDILDLTEVYKSYPDNYQVPDCTLGDLITICLICYDPDNIYLTINTLEEAAQVWFVMHSGVSFTQSETDFED